MASSGKNPEIPDLLRNLPSVDDLMADLRTEGQNGASTPLLADAARSAIETRRIRIQAGEGLSSGDPSGLRETLRLEILAQARESADRIRRDATAAVDQELRQARANRTSLLERLAQGAHGRSLPAICRNRKIVRLVLDRLEAQACLPGDGLDRNAPVRSFLTHRGRDRVVRTRLVGVAGRTALSE